MKIEQLRRVRDADPFCPFMIHLVNGRKVSVLRREFMAIAPSGRRVVVCQPDDRLDIIDLSMVNDLDLKAPTKRRKR